MSGHSATVLYPKKDGAKFDMSYYLKTHMPLVEKTWAPLGLTGWKVVDLQPGGDGSQPYSVQAILYWKDSQSMATAVGSHGKDVFGDVPNFSSEGPLLIAGGVVGSSG